MADSAEGDTHEGQESREQPLAPAEYLSESPSPSSAIATPPSVPTTAAPPSTLERWRTPLIVALVVVFLVFGVFDASTLLFHPAHDSGTTRPLIVNAQIVGDPAPAAHPDLGLTPASLTVACNATSRITVTNLSARPLQWTVTTDGDAVTFTADTARSGLLGPGQSISLTVMAFSQPGTYLLHYSDDHGESADVTVQVSC